MKRSLSSRAFTLIEIVLAVGIISFSLVGILGLFPVAMNAARESREETQAAFVARTLFAGLLADPAFLPSNANLDAANPVDFGASSPTEVFHFSPDGDLLASAEGAYFTAEVQWTPNTPTQGLTNVSVAVSFPGRDPLTFVTLVRGPSPAGVP